mmetsp:Transcript_34699/g.53212  ORF Transcript_34699/g.53212 Transcript_34699/m.53212 type:complete len:288 (-) Transcript_34699:2140-3003(-)
MGPRRVTHYVRQLRLVTTTHSHYFLVDVNVVGLDLVIESQLLILSERNLVEGPALLRVVTRLAHTDRHLLVALRFAVVTSARVRIPIYRRRVMRRVRACATQLRCLLGHLYLLAELVEVRVSVRMRSLVALDAFLRPLVRCFGLASDRLGLALGALPLQLVRFAGHNADGVLIRGLLSQGVVRIVPPVGVVERLVYGLAPDLLLLQIIGDATRLHNVELAAVRGRNAHDSALLRGHRVHSLVHLQIALALILLPGEVGRLHMQALLRALVLRFLRPFVKDGLVYHQS